MRSDHSAASVDGLQNYARALLFSARTDEALAISAEATGRALALYGAGSKGAVQADLQRGNLLWGSGRHADAATLLQSALHAWRSSGRAPSEDFLQGLTDLSRIQNALGETAAAEASLRETLATAERIYEPPHDRIALALLNLGDTLSVQWRLDEAEPVLTRAVAMMQAVYGDGHLRVANSLSALGKLKLRQRDLAAATQHLHAAVVWCDRKDLHATRSCIGIHSNEAELAIATGNLDTAQASIDRALAMTQELFPQGHLWTAQLWQTQAELQVLRNDAAGALTLCDQATALLARLGQQHGVIAEAVLARRASALHALGRVVEAEAATTQALAMWHKLAPAGYLHQIELFDALASIQTRLGDDRGARDAARNALALVRDRSLIEPALLERIDALAGQAR